jgi:hypothetical protein
MNSPMNANAPSSLPAFARTLRRSSLLIRVPPSYPRLRVSAVRFRISGHKQSWGDKQG